MHVEAPCVGFWIVEERHILIHAEWQLLIIFALDWLLTLATVHLLLPAQALQP